MSLSIPLAGAIRSNLTALQDVAALQSATQQRLATGRKVNSALDNPTNYFTAAALTARARALTSLLDAMTSGINTLKAADHGLASITMTIESMQATVIQARQDASWRSGSYDVDAAAIGQSTPKTLAFSGASIGSTSVQIPLNGVVVAAKAASDAGAAFSAIPGLETGGARVAAATAYGPLNAFVAQSSAIKIGPTFPTAVSVTFDGTTDGTTLIADQTTHLYSEAEAILKINHDLAAGGSTVRASDDGSGHLLLANTASGAGSNFKIYGLGVADNGGYGFQIISASNGTNPGAGVGFTITVGVGAPQTISVSPNDIANAGADPLNAGTNSVNLTAAINAKLVAAGIATVQAVKSGAAGVSASTDTIMLQAVAYGSATSFSVSNVIGSLIGTTVTPGVDASGVIYSVDQLVSSINTNGSLSGKVRASNNAGQLQLTNLSVGVLTITGINSANGRIDGSGGTATITGNATRASLVTQFNLLRDQLDKTAADASFNGLNLLAGDALKLYFNETSTSTLTVQSSDPRGVDCASLGIVAATDAEFEDNARLDARLQTLHTAQQLVASQSSAFGSNLSIAENRQTFTNALVNTLQTGADGLTLADGNLEGASMLTLQTRQQLSIQALSLASQANQAVLRLFG